MEKILITGGGGFIGGSLAEELSKDPRNIIYLFDNFLTSSLGNIPINKNIYFVKGDVNKKNELKALMKAHRFDHVFHYAAVVGVKRTLENPIGVLNDIEGIKNILKFSHHTGVKRVFFSSSSEVYGEPVEHPQNEATTPLNSKLPYAIVKNIGEAYCKSFQKEYGLKYTVFRFFNTYGPRQSRDFVIPRFIHQALNNENITIHGEGTQRRTFCYIQDNIDFTLKTLQTHHYVNDTVNVGCGIQTSIIDLAKLIIRLTGSDSKIIHLPPLKEGDMSMRMPDNSKMINLLDRPLKPLEEGLMELIKIESTRKSRIVCM
ncbi:NAD-dependent epimerase/dehydratase family protein [Hymenobacter sp. BT175]|uniref:NAD-dependent epimerase/dehydratase family protein n=1 Tax=Hymenobacter translucens TaxID=2886507 RepID=UPI001D0E7989|nr:NAD-dependent epimerase/dehydratase family protein [Hymenobacter translucens]MCC2547646.1 NAD-dependent epimerase/dehydratase family protein [Hymenobacter translucens]